MKTQIANLILLFVFSFLLLSCEIEDRNPTPTYHLIVSASPFDGGTLAVSPSASSTDLNGDGIPDYGPYTEGQKVTLTPKPDPNWVFEKWQGDTSGTSNPMILTMYTDKNITAVFVRRD